MAKKKFFLVIDVETTRGYDKNKKCYNLVYDCGFVVCDRMGHIYEQHSYIVRDIFRDENKMSSAYYATKIPTYKEGIKNGLHKEVSFAYIHKVIENIYEKYNISAICAYNANFDKNALNSTYHWFYKNIISNFFPNDIEINCIWNMATQVICIKKSYIDFCVKNGYVTEKGNICTGAEYVYRFLTKDTEFQEIHKGLDDVIIEVAIMANCYRQHKKMDKMPCGNPWKRVQEKYIEIYSE